MRSLWQTRALVNDRIFMFNFATEITRETRRCMCAELYIVRLISCKLILLKTNHQQTKQLENNRMAQCDVNYQISAYLL